MVPPPSNPSKVCVYESLLKGRVQGVGFRPWAYHFGRERRLRGSVQNIGDGVRVRICGTLDKVTSILLEMQRTAPEPIHIQSISEPIELEIEAQYNWEISESAHPSGLYISADRKICTECQRDMDDPHSPFYNYSLISCAQCGPRASFQLAFPYDRRNTSAIDFPMCSSCELIYHDAHQRRFHAQSFNCAQCGPRVSYCISQQGGVAQNFFDSDAIVKACADLQRGKLLLIKGVAGFHLCCDASSIDIIHRCRSLKNRPLKPFAVMFKDSDSAWSWLEIGPRERAELNSWRCPLVLCRKRENTPLAEALAPGLSHIAMMLPSNGLHWQLLKNYGGPLVMTSANASFESPCLNNEDALTIFGDTIAGYLWHPRKVHWRCDDTLLKISGCGPILLRRGRGYAPEAFPLPLGFKAARPLLSTGALFNNTFSLAWEDRMMVSSHMGDLTSLSNQAERNQTILRFLKMAGIQKIDLSRDVHFDDLHEDLLEDLKSSGIHVLEVYRVQHHHAHFVSALWDAGLMINSKATLGIVLDGIGLGENGEFWGGEFLLGNANATQRIGRLQPQFLPGGDIAAREPWRNALAHFHKLNLFAENLPEACHFWRSHPNYQNLEKVLSNLHWQNETIRTSSCGRWFDAVSAVLSLAPAIQEYEGQAAMLLESAALSYEDLLAKKTESHSPEIQNNSSESHASPPKMVGYPIALEINGALWELSPRALWPALLEDLVKGMDSSVMAWRFHEGLAQGCVAMAQQLRQQHGFNNVVLSGGCFNNALLRDRLIQLLEQAHFTVGCHKNLPSGDGGVSAGQLLSTLALLNQPHPVL